MDESTAEEGERSNFHPILFSVSLRFTPSGLTRKIAPGDFFVT